MSTQPPSDITDPKTQRRIWRRLWIGVGLFAILTPIIIWVAVDQGGKAEWRGLQAELQAKGVATTITELDLPSRDNVPDEENYCSLPWLAGDAKGSDSPAMRELVDSLRIFQAYSISAPNGLKSSPFLGEATDLDAWAALIAAKHADPDIESDIDFHVTDSLPPAEQVLARIEVVPSYWEQQDAAVDRLHAVWLPLQSELLAQKDYPSPVMRGTGFSMLKLSMALRLRTIAAVKTGDFDRALNSIDALSRMAEANSQEGSFISIMSVSLVTKSLCATIHEVLWDREFCADPLRVAHCQRALERVDLQQALTNLATRDIVILSELIRHLGSLSRQQRDDILLPFEGSLESALHVWAPQGWFDRNAAELFRRVDAGVLSQLDNGSCLYAVALASEKPLNTEIQAFGATNRSMLPWVVLVAPSWPKLLGYVPTAETYRRLTVTACAIHRYRSDHDAVSPEKLGNLVPDYLAQIPTDPMDGKPLRYTRTSDRPFVLYSVGTDGNDDAGRMPLDESAGTPFSQNSDYQGDLRWLTEPASKNILEIETPDSPTESPRD